MDKQILFEVFGDITVFRFDLGVFCFGVTGGTSDVSSFSSDPFILRWTTLTWSTSLFLMWVLYLHSSQTNGSAATLLPGKKEIARKNTETIRVPFLDVSSSALNKRGGPVRV